MLQRLGPLPSRDTQDEDAGRDEANGRRGGEVGAEKGTGARAVGDDDDGGEGDDIRKRRRRGGGSEDRGPRRRGDEESSSRGTASSASPPSKLGMIAYSRNMYAEGGLGAFYSGIGTSAIQSATEKSLYFFAYTFLKNGYKGLTGSDDIDPLPNLVLGSLAEWAHLPVTLPIDCLTTKIQTDHTGRGAVALLCSMLSEKGPGGMYKGIQAYVVLCLKPAIQYTVYEQVKKVVLLKRSLAHGGGGGKKRGRVGGGGEREGESLAASEAFLLGMVARTVATIAVFPYLRAKVMLQSTHADRKDASGGAVGIPAMILEMYNEGGLSEVFQGIGPELTRGVFSAALMMMAKEKIGVVVSALVEAHQGRR